METAAVERSGGTKGPTVPHVPIEKVIKRIDEISTLPHVAVSVTRLANDPETGAAELREALESDPSLSTRLLRCVNSAAYSLRTKVTNLQQAISLLGFNQVRNLAITASVSECFKKDDRIGPYSRSGLWQHLVSVAICARLIAARRKLPNFEDAFLAGLLHDIGIILEDQQVHEGFCAMAQSLDANRPLAEAEREYLGFDHTILGARVAELWKFPPAVQASIRHHHRSEAYHGNDAALVQCVEVANLICTLKGISSVGVKLVRLPKAALAALSLQREDIKVLAIDLDHEIALHDSLFKM